MSVRISAAVWEYSAMGDTKLNLLLAIADIANDDGEAHPGRLRLAKKVRKTDRHVKRLLGELVKTPELVIEPMAGPRGTNVYWIPLLPGEAGYDPQPCTLEHRCNGNHHPLPEHDQKRTGRKPTPRGDTVTSPPSSQNKKPRKGGTQLRPPQGDTVTSPQGDTVTSPQGDTVTSPEPSVYVSYTSVDVERHPLSLKNEEAAEPEPEPDPPPFRAAPPAFNDFARDYRTRHGIGARYSDIHRAYQDYCEALEAEEIEA